MVTKRHRKFTVTEPENVEPLTFEVEFKNEKTGKSGSEEFECHPELQGAVILDFVAAADGTGNAVAGKLIEFFDHALVEESAARFSTMIHDPKRIVDMNTLSEIVAWLVEEYTERPTMAS